MEAGNQRGKKLVVKHAADLAPKTILEIVGAMKEVVFLPFARAVPKRACRRRKRLREFDREFRESVIRAGVLDLCIFAPYCPILTEVFHTCE
jgi:hypothetical protein